MTEIPSVLILAKDEDATAARKLRDILAEKYGKPSAWWSVKRYLDNEYQLTGFQPMIFLGDPSVNEVTKAYQGRLDVKQSNDDFEIAMGFNKAAIWGKGTAELTLLAVDKFIANHLENFVNDLK